MPAATPDEKLVLRNATLERLLQDKANELKVVKRAAGATEQELASANQMLELVRSIREASPREPKWTRPKRSRKAAQHHAIPTLMLSDLHLDEVVRPEEVGWYNAYDRSIAEARLRRTAEKAVMILKDYVAGLDFDGLVLVLGGDILSGDIHQELAKSNEATVFDSIVHWVPQLATLIEYLLTELDVPLFIPCVVGNHDRNPANRRSPAKGRARDSVSWVIYAWLADRFRDDDRVTFQVSEAADALYPVYDTTYLLTHGDQFKGGNGIGGIYMPISRGAYKKKQVYAAKGTPFDVMILGHFHQYIAGPQFIVNGSLKGWDEYAEVSNFVPEVPAQALWITTPERGITMHMPVHPASSDEAWRK